MKRLGWGLAACASVAGMLLSFQLSSPEAAAICGGATVLSFGEALSKKEKNK